MDHETPPKIHASTRSAIERAQTAAPPRWCFECKGFVDSRPDPGGILGGIEVCELCAECVADSAPGVYLASSWRNTYQPDALSVLRCEGYGVYDFRHPLPGDEGFHWYDLDAGDFRQWTPAEYREALTHPIAQRGFASDMGAMEKADACVVVMPCGRSAHLEAGWFCGRRRPCIFYYPDAVDTVEAELMVGMGDGIAIGYDELLAKLGAALADWAPAG